MLVLLLWVCAIIILVQQVWIAILRERNQDMLTTLKLVKQSQDLLRDSQKALEDRK